MGGGPTRAFQSQHNECIVRTSQKVDQSLALLLTYLAHKVRLERFYCGRTKSVGSRSPYTANKYLILNSKFQLACAQRNMDAGVNDLGDGRVV